jgi:hypothetical protein
MKRSTLAINVLVVLLAVALCACANTGIVPTGKDTYLIAKKSPQVGFGPPIGIKGDGVSLRSQIGLHV